MRVRHLLPIGVAVTALAPATASAYFAHTVLPGESLYSIAATDGLSVAQLAAANGLSPSALLVTGTTVQIPSQGGGVAQNAPVGSSSAVVGDGDDDSDDGVVAPAGSAVAVSTTTSSGSYVVQPGDTLSAIAARAGLSVSGLAAANGLSLNGTLVSGTALRLAGAPRSVTSVNPAVGQPVGTAAQGSVVDPPYPTPERVTAAQIGQVAASNGVSPSLAAAIAWQESGFNNDLVSPADARGVMQILPGTWRWIQNSLNPGAPLAPASAIDNVRGGVLLLHSLLGSTGGDPALAAAGYYQGLPSVERYGVYPSTQQYINSVLALRQRFGGG